MISVNGKYAQALILCPRDEAGLDVDPYAIAQVQMICDHEAAQGSTIRVMPDIHPGKVGPIGLTMTVGENILPALVGIDIGCGMLSVQLGKVRNDFQRLDRVIRESVPAGFGIRSKPHSSADQTKLEELCCYKHIRAEKALLSLGTLGGGNHFIELDVDEKGEAALLIHTGSRHLGKEVAEYYMAQGQRSLKDNGITDVPYEMTYLGGELMKDYLHDLCIVQEYADLNRRVIASEILKGMKWKSSDFTSCIHNYVDFSGEVPMLRKGAISAKQGEKVIIPINMKDGVLIGQGNGNARWNCSAPHGSGRLLSREQVLKSHTLSEFKSAMKGVYSSCIRKDTLDEAPFAYRGMDYIQEAVKETVQIERMLAPIYNYKDGNGKG